MKRADPPAPTERRRAVRRSRRLRGQAGVAGGRRRPRQLGEDLLNRLGASSASANEPPDAPNASAA